MKMCLENRLAELLRSGRQLFLLLLCVVACQPVFAQVWRLDTADVDEVSGMPLTMATLDLELLGLLSIGDVFDVYVDDSQKYTIRINDISEMSNGDRRWYGSIIDTGLDYSLVITAGSRTAHLILTSPSGIFQLFGKSTNSLYFRGRFNRLEHVRDEVASTEIIQPSGESGDDNLDVFSNDPFIITQSVSQTSAPIGAELKFDLHFINNSSTNLSLQYVDIFFVLENTTLKQLPSNCEKGESTQFQPVMSCELGNFAANEQKSLSYTVITTELSHPEVLSTARVGETRNGVFVELARSDLDVDIYRDVITDSDGDGVSDYNESLQGTDPLVWESDADKTAYIDVLVAYTADISDIYLGEVNTRINQLFNVANKIFADSRTGIQLRPVGIHEVTYSPEQDLLADLSAVTFRTDDSFQNLGRLRELYGGDLVVLFRSGEENGLCGLANLGGKGTQADLTARSQRDFESQRDYAISVINIDCMDDSVLAHEIGHNMGLVHSRREDIDGGTLPYSAGFGVDTRFVSIMAFPDDFDVVNRLYRFSDPDRACGPYLCGEDREDPEHGADAVSSLKLVKHQVAAYYSSQEDRIGALPAVSSQDGVVDSILGVSAYSPAGSGFRTSFPATETINLRMKITPLPQQVGRRFVPHLVVMSDKAHLFQATGTGELVPWNGDLKTLIATQASRVLGDRELVDVVKAIDLQSVGLLDRNVHVFVAYRMTDTGELVYGASPFSFRVNSIP